MKTRPAMGEWCMIKNRAVKRQKYINPKDWPQNARDAHNVRWHKLNWTPEPIEAMYIGFRIKREGVYWATGGSEDYEQCFKCEKTIEVWLFVKNGRSKPMAVFPEDIDYIKGLST